MRLGNDSGPSVLIVDDERSAVTTLAALLAALGCHVSYTFDPRLALAMARRCKPKIAFLDLRMPHVTGFHLARAFQAEKTLDDCALVALSGYGSVYGWGTLKTGFRALLSKPATLDELAAVVDMFAPGNTAAAAACA